VSGRAAAKALCGYVVAALLVTLPSLSRCGNPTNAPLPKALEQSQERALQQKECSAPKTGIDSSSAGD